MLLQRPPGEGHLQEERGDEEERPGRGEPIHEEKGEGKEARGPDPADDPGGLLDPGSPPAGVAPPPDEPAEEGDRVKPALRVSGDPVHPEGRGED